MSLILRNEVTKLRLSKRGRYAVIAVFDMACCNKNKPLNLSDLAHKQDISVSYLEQIFSKLKKAELVKSVRGPGGGYVLSRDLENIVIADIIRAVDPEFGRDNSFAAYPKIEILWDKMNRQMVQLLEVVTLFQLCQEDLSILPFETKVSA